MPLVNRFESGNLYYSKKQLRNFNQYSEALPTIETAFAGDEIFSAIGSLIAPATNFMKANSELIKPVTSSAANLTSAGKNISDAVNTTKKANEEIEQLKRIRYYTKNKANTSNATKIISYTPTEEGSSSSTKLNKQQESAIEKLAQNLSKQKLASAGADSVMRLGKGFKMY